MNVARRESVPIGERTSDNWGVCAGRRFPGKHALFLISLTVLRLRGGPLARPPASEGLGDKRERPPPIGVPRSAPRRVGMCTAMPPPARGSLPHHQSLQEGCSAPRRDGGSPVRRRPRAGVACALVQGTGRCAADRADLGGRLSCREGRALSWRSGFPGP